MSRNSFLTVLGGIALLFALLLFVIGRGNAPHSESGDNHDLIAAIDRIAANQTELSQRMDRLEYRLGASGDAPGRPLMGDRTHPTVTASTDQNGQNLTPADRDALLASSLHTLEDQLVRDPLSPQWASANEKVIGDFLSKTNLSRQQLPVPKDFKAECHSHLCKISMSYSDPGQADQTESMLLTEIAPSLPNAQTLVLPQPDGSVQMVVFAGDAQGFRHP
jgi:hypothetical protein